ncbi:MAG: hypothetical protein J6Y78_01460 [Paludibacteraceae bacterium]|nr:hypothetical protein [Paludibacteraceae bacterium]
MKKIVSTLWLLLLGLGSLYAATAYTGCPDFTDLTASYVEPYASGVGNQLVKGRHSLIDKQGADPRTGGKLQLLPKGVDRVIRLGDEFGGNQSESLTYHLIPGWDASLILLKYAVVFENPNHKIEEQPFFSISVTDKDGNLLPETFQYSVYANNGLAGFEEYVDGNSTVMWRDWTDAVVDLSSYIGQEVLITFHTRDCLQNGHYAYAYFTSVCTSRGHVKLFCNENNILLSMIDGFSSYHWSDGTDSKDYEGSLDQPVWCDVTSVVGMVTKIFVALADNATSSMADVVYDKVCEGEDYSWLGHSIDTRFKGTRKFNGVVVNKDSCSISSKILMLTTIPTRFEFNETICEGEDYFKNGFKFKNPPVGEYNDSIEVDSDTECKHWNVLKLRVVPKTISPILKGEETPCMNSRNTYNVPGDYSCEWILPTNALYEEGKTPDYAYLTFTDHSESVISVTCSNGCVSKTVTKTIRPIQTYKTYFIDTICQGATYEKDGWNLGVQNRLGYSTYIRQLGDSCRSTDVLVLYVQQSPNIQVLSVPDVVCSGDEVKLSTSNKMNDEDVEWAIGDVWCTDGSLVKLKDYPNSGKIAKGIVYNIAFSYDDEETITKFNIVSIVDENNGNAVPYDVSTMDNNDNIFSYFTFSQFSIFHGKWFLLNNYLSQIEGADLLSGLYWTKTYINGSQDTHRNVMGYVDGNFVEESIPMNETSKIRYYYTIEKRIKK